jgi:hypothetical protein
MCYNQLGCNCTDLYLKSEAINKLYEKYADTPGPTFENL